jgi:PHD/YefM family antitoxin component YafN of YafNO toxin-antitoxin module
MKEAVHPRYLVDEDGRRRAVVLDIEEYERLMDLLEDAADLRVARARANEPTEPYGAARRRILRRR